MKVAEACGARGVHIEDPADADRLVADAFATRGPVVIEAVIDANEAPMPARTTKEQALHFAESLLRGQPDRLAIAATPAGNKIREMV